MTRHTAAKHDTHTHTYTLLIFYASFYNPLILVFGNARETQKSVVRDINRPLWDSDSEFFLHSIYRGYVKLYGPKFPPPYHYGGPPSLRRALLVSRLHASV